MTKDGTQIEVAVEAMIATTLTEVTVTQAIVAIQTVTRTIAEVEVEAVVGAVVILPVQNEKLHSNSHLRMKGEKLLLLQY